MDADLTVDLLAAALSGLDQLVSDTELDERQREQLHRHVAAAVLPAVAVSLKYLMASHGQAILPGFGAFTIVQGAVNFLPEEDVAEYVHIAESDPGRRSQAIATSILQQLQNSASLLSWVEPSLDEPVSVETTPEQKLLRAIFGEAPSMSLRAAIQRIARGLLDATALRVDTPPAKIESATEPLNPRIKSNVQYTDAPHLVDVFGTTLGPKVLFKGPSEATLEQKRKSVRRDKPPAESSHEP